MFVFRKIWCALFSWKTGFEIRLFALLPMNKFLMIYSRVPNSKNELFKNELFLFLFVQCGWYLFFFKYWVPRKIKSMLLIPYGKCLPLIPYPLESIAFSNYFLLCISGLLEKFNIKGLTPWEISCSWYTWK